MTRERLQTKMTRAARSWKLLAIVAALIWAIVCGANCSLGGAATGKDGELLVLPGELGHPGGRLVVSLRAEPKTLNPLIAADAPSREVLSVMQADLIHINRSTQLTEPALAKSWKISADGLHYTLKIREGLRFSDGQPLSVDDIMFSFQLYLDESIRAPQRDLLIVGGKPIEVRKLDAQTVVFDLARPYGAAERLFDGLAILPRHLLERIYKEGKLAQSWTLTTQSAQIAGLGPFRLKEYVPGQRLVLERNPYYWKADGKGARLPYLDELVFLFVPSADAQVIRFQSGETDVISRVSADSFAILGRQSREFSMTDAGPGLEYNFLFFNLSDTSAKTSPEMARKQEWFKDLKFRQAVSSAVDREGIVRLVYKGRGAPLWSSVTPGNHLWMDSAIPRPARSLDHARELLRAAAFSWRNDSNGDSQLYDRRGAPVEFSIATSSSNADRMKMATIIQDDLRQLGMRVQVVPLEFRSLLDRVFQTREYEACVLGLASFDADPNSDINVWLSSGGSHMWNPSQTHPTTPWEAEIDRLMEQQLTAKDFAQRKRLFDRVQEIVAENQPMIFLASPDILVGARENIGNIHPAILEPYVLWNAEQIFLRKALGAAKR
jgi:peptide/nickel transport system substrate-binding protein